MKILIVSKDGYGAWFSLRLEEEGHSVDYYLLDNNYKNVLRGIAPAPLKTKPSFGQYDLVLFDVTGMPKMAELAVKEAPTIGDSMFASMLEDDRLFGIEVMESANINVPPYEHFDDIKEAKKFIRQFPKRYVFKPFTMASGEEQSSAATYVSSSAEDLTDYLDKLGELSKGVEFILQEVIDGIEVACNAYFNGEEFYFITSTIEEKKFMNDGRGPNTGCSGNLIYSYARPPKLFEHGLGRMKDILVQAGFKGAIDLNTIVTREKLYGLEWTPRFGYDSSATELRFFNGRVGEFWGAIASGSQPHTDYNAGSFTAAVRISIPPYPNEMEGMHPEGVPIHGVDAETAWRDFYLYDAMLDEKDELVTGGVTGFVGCPIAEGLTIEEAFFNLHHLSKEIKIPDMQLRTDIMVQTKRRYDAVAIQGWLR